MLPAQGEISWAEPDEDESGTWARGARRYVGHCEP
jgi:hypothetical protein